tara:strand:- start:102 stop:776 length:675 start_codon:yes stop_codon:yes gene_type:complete
MTKILKVSSFSNHINPNKLIILLHGYGDNANNFINIGKVIDTNEWAAHYIALNAPNHIDNHPIGFEWFNLYPNGIYISEAGSKEIKIIKAQIEESVLKIETTLKFYIDKFKLLLSDCIIIGFSQGGMMTFEIGNYLKDRLAGLAILSGRIMNEVPITNLNLLKTPIFISHGDKDEVLSFNNFNNSIEYLKSNKFNFESHVLEGDTHIISTKTINLLQKFIKKNL